jgi:hypothetical protein
MATNKHKPQSAAAGPSSSRKSPTSKTGQSTRKNTHPAAPPPPVVPGGKLGLLVGLLLRPDGVRLGEMTAATGWQAHSVRGALSGSIKKKLGYALASEATDGGRVYRIVMEQQA